MKKTKKTKPKKTKPVDVKTEFKPSPAFETALKAVEEMKAPKKR